MVKKYKIYLANLNIEVPVHQLHDKDSQVTILVKDVPEKLRRVAALSGKTAKYWYGPNAGSNRLIEVGKEEKEDQRKAREFVESAAKAIVDMAEGMRTMLNGKLNKRALVLLIHAAAGRQSVTQEQVENVLAAIADLDKTFLKK